MRHFALTAAIPCIAAMALTGAALGKPQQDEPPPHIQQLQAQRRLQQGSPVQDANRPPMPIIDVDFPGGTVLAFTRAVQKAATESTAKTPVNVMIPGDAAEITIPAISLKRVSAATALETLQYAFGMGGLHQFSTRNMTNDGDEGLTFAVQYSPGRSAGFIQRPQIMQPVQSEAYSLRDLIAIPANLPQNDPSLRMSPDSILAALKLAAELEADDVRVAPTQLLFHPDTQLLIGRGTSDQHRLIRGVLEQFIETIRQRRDQLATDQARARSNELQHLELDAQVQIAQANMDKAISEMRPARAEVERLEKLVESGSASSAELARARANLEVAGANTASAESHLVMMMKRRELIEKSASGASPAGAPPEQIVVIYDVRDLANFKKDFNDLVKTVISPDGKMEVKPGSGDATGFISVRTTRSQHEVLVSIFNTARRLKANEPRLPGLTLDQLIEQSKE